MSDSSRGGRVLVNKIAPTFRDEYYEVGSTGLAVVINLTPHFRNYT